MPRQRLGKKPLETDAQRLRVLMNTATTPGSHNPVTLDTDADTLLKLTNQELGLDTQTANRVFAGPATGAAAVPTFRALVAADLPGTYVPTSRTVTAGAGLTGGGDLTTNRTIDAGEGPGVDITADAIGLGGDTILLYDSGGNPIAEYAATGAGLALALAAATSGDVVTVPAGTFDTSQSIPAGVTLQGLDKHRSTLTGQISLANTAHVCNLSITRTANDANDLIGVYCASGVGYVTNCRITCTQSGAGGAYAAEIAGTGIIEVEGGYLYGLSVGGAYYDLYHAATASGYFKARAAYLPGLPSN